MTRLTSQQGGRLRALAHHLKPVAHIGAGGLTDARHPEKPEIRLPEA